MNRLFKKILFVMSIFVLVLISVVVTEAAGKWYYSTISISDNSKFSGIERAYNYSKYTLDINPTMLNEGPRSHGEV